MKVICTICSKDKKTDSGLLPAYQRYSSDRISLVKMISEQQSIPFFILSGEYGLISADYPIPWYDHLLTINEVDQLSQKVSDQLSKLNVSHITFYAKNRQQPNWEAYYQTLEKAVSTTGIKLDTKLLD